jgi:DNA-binding NarL/FixJ family response regulator
MTAKILIVDDNAFIRSAVRHLIEQNPEWQACGEAENGAIALEKVRELSPNVVILDLAMPVMNGIEAAQHIRRIAPATALVMFTLHTNPALLKYADSIGIDQLVSKCEGSLEHLGHAIQSVVSPSPRGTGDSG